MANSYCFTLLQDDVYSNHGEEAEYLTFDANSKLDAVVKVADHYNIVGYDDVEDDSLSFKDVCKILKDFAKDFPDEFFICMIVYKGEVVYRGDPKVCCFNSI